MHDPIPFNRPCFEGRELEYISEAIANAKLSGDGDFGRRCEKLLADVVGCARALLTPSCTHALEMAAMLLELEPGDEVIVPSFTFVTTANAFVLRGAIPVFADIRPDTLCLDESLLESLITPRTRAVVPVHYAGVACEMDAIGRVAQQHNLTVIEDNAHGLFGAYRGKPLGSFGALATQSFHETKNFQCGEGGALLINDGRLIDRAQILREKGTDRTRFFLGLVDKYTWVDIGSSYLLSELNAAYLLAQFEARERIQSHRKNLWNAYHQGLRDWAATNNVRTPHVPDHCDQAWHMYYLVLPTAADRDRFIDHLNAQHINAVFHYLPLHRSKMGQRFCTNPNACPVTVDISARLVRLPFYNNLSDPERDRVIETVRAFEVA